MRKHEQVGQIKDNFQVFGETSGDYLFTIPVDQRGCQDSDRVSVGDRIRLSYGEGYISFERIR